MAARAQEARKPASLTEPKIKDLPAASTAIETPPTGNNVSATGKNSPPTPGVEPSTQKPGHTAGLERAVERLQQNAVKSPEAAGLQHALEMLQRNRERASTVDTRA
jgi:hypothetical protein